VPSLVDCRILVVEDEVIVAMELEAMLRDAGCATVAMASSVPEALQAVGEQAFDAALLDVNLKGETSFRVADALDDAGVPCLLLTGQSPAGLPEHRRRLTVIGKPYDPAMLLRTVSSLIEQRK